MEKKLGYAAFTALIMLLCLIPSLGMLLPKGETGAGGNQVIAAAPSLRDGEGNLNPDYLSQLLDYIEDNHFLRQDMITAWSSLNVKVLRTSITEDVVLGKNDWLYFGETLPDYAGTDLLSGREVYAAARNLALMAEDCERQGRRFLFTIAPNKNALYPENMPDLSVASAARNADALAAALEKQGVPYLNLFPLFRDQEEVLYFTQDSHWNSKGAALAADALNKALGRESSYFEGPFLPTADHRSDLYDMLYPTGPDLETDLKYGGVLDFTYDVPIRSAENLTIMTTGGGEGSLLMFRDSFGNLLYPYLADGFAHALFSRSMPYRLDLAEQRAADTVVIELVERNLRYLIQNVPAMPAPRRSPGLSDRFDAVVESAPSDVLPGYLLVTGILPAPAAEASPVYLETPSGCYEAFLQEDGGFGLYIPETPETDLRNVSLRFAAA